MTDAIASYADAIEAIARDEAGQVIATLIGLTGDFDLAEDAWQDALVAALEHWPNAGIPTRPGAWLTQTARRKALDRLRCDALFLRKRQEIEADLLREEQICSSQPESPISDDRLALLFTCCHPALNLEARVALTLRTLGGLSTAEIAHAFLVPIPTMAQRLIRAKNKIRAARIPYRVPPLEQLPERLSGLLAVLYLIFNAGYAAYTGAELLRADLCAEAIRLTRLLAALYARMYGDDPETLGLLALMVLHDARRPARIDASGSLVTLEEQDRTRWDRASIAEGAALVEGALGLGHPGMYQIQAAIAALHNEAPTAAATDWCQIVALYAILREEFPSPIIALNHAVAVAMAYGPPAGLRLLDTPALAEPLAEYHLFHAARADLLRRDGQFRTALIAYRQALTLCQNAVEQTYLRRRIEAIRADTGDADA